MTSLIAVLLSLAMMLTGASGAEVTEPTASVLTISNISITYNDDTIDLDPALQLGAMTDGQKAVFQVALELGGEMLFPMQMSANGDALTLLSVNSDKAVRVSMAALDDLMAQAQEEVVGETDEESQQILDYLRDDLVPAYTALFDAVKDPEAMARIEAAANEAFYATVDRGEGAADTLELNGATYPATTWHYAIQGETFGDLADAVYASSPELKNVYDALFKMFSMMPEETGLANVTSYSDLMAMTQLDMTVAVDETISEDGAASVRDVVMTLDLAKAVAAQLEEGEEMPDVPPVALVMHMEEQDGVSDATVSCDYAVEEQNVSISIQMDIHEDADLTTANMTMTMDEDGEVVSAVMVVAKSTDAQTGEQSFSASYTVSADGTDVNFDADAVTTAEGEMEGRLAVSAAGEGMHVGFSCDVTRTHELFEDAADGHEAFEITDLSEETLGALQENTELQGLAVEVMGGLTTDAGKLMGNDSVQALMGLFTADPTTRVAQIETYDDDGNEEYDYTDDDEDRDDGVLPFGEPKFTYLPEGWEVTQMEVDTEYDNVDLQLSNGEDNIYAYFYPTYGDDGQLYTLSDEGVLTAVEGNTAEIEMPYDGYISGQMVKDGVNISLYVYSDDIDLETFGLILSGIEF